MEFTSIVFIIFICITVTGQTLFPRRIKPYFLLVSNLVFYGYYNVSVAVFMVMFSLAVFLAGIRLKKRKNRQLLFLFICIGLASALYLISRYSSLINTLVSSFSGGSISISIVFPLGFSYCMFKCIGYLADIYFETLEPCRRFDRFLAYTMFFPEISMGPLTRANEFIPQLGNEKPLTKERLTEGTTLIIWGFFKKLVFADWLAILISPYYQNISTIASGFEWLVILICYFVQLYLDFSAYTDIAFGISKLLGYDTRHNFLAPMASQTMSEYWRRWHTSLSSWLSDYIFTPLQFAWRKLGIYASAAAAIVTLTISGVWHAVTPGFIIWGIIMGICVAFDAVFAQKRKKLGKKLPRRFFTVVNTAITFFVNILMLAFTRASDAEDAMYMIGSVFSKPWTASTIPTELYTALASGFLVCVASQLLETRRDSFFLHFSKINIALRWLCYLVLIFAVILFSAAETDILGGFIYAQF